MTRIRIGNGYSRGRRPTVPTGASVVGGGGALSGLSYRTSHSSSQRAPQGRLTEPGRSNDFPQGPALDAARLDPELAEALNLGVEALDSDHRHVVAHYQSLLNALDQDHDAATFANAFDGLLSAAHHHFAREEALMKRYRFPGFHLHRTAHKKLLRDGHDFVANILTVYARDDYVAVAKFVKYWIVGHIGTHDRAFSMYMQRMDGVEHA